MFKLTTNSTNGIVPPGTLLIDVVCSTCVTTRKEAEGVVLGRLCFICNGAGVLVVLFALVIDTNATAANVECSCDLSVGGGVDEGCATVFDEGFGFAEVLKVAVRTALVSAVSFSI